MSNIVTVEELEKELKEIDKVIEHERAVDARQTVKKLERIREIHRLAIVGLKLSPFENDND